MSLTHKQAVKITKVYGYILTGQNGSHQKFLYGSKQLIIPEHKELKPGTSLQILKIIANHHNIDHKDIIKEFNIKL